MEPLKKTAPITVVIPYYNESATISKTLTMLDEQTLAPTEVIFVDSGSSDDSPAIIDRWIQARPSGPPTRYTNNRARTGVPSSSKNAGIREAKSELIAFMDCGLIFPAHWLESHFRLLNEGNHEIVHTSGCFRGDDGLDRAAIAQTYGFGRVRASVPGSLVKKEVFQRTGLFIEGLRAGYDADWLRRIRRLGIRRTINADVVIEYMGKSYTSGFKHLFKKTVLYSKPCVGLERYYFPYLYCLFPIVPLLAVVLCPVLLPVLAILYLILRGYVLPVVKSRRMDLFGQIPGALFYLPAAALVIDFGKFVGYWKGWINRSMSLSC